MAQSKTVRILVVDDNEGFRDTILDLVAQEPSFQIVLTESTGEDALASLRTILPDLVLLDFSLPGINGLETARRIKEQYPRVVIVMISASIDEIIYRFAKEISIREVIPKAELTLGKLREIAREV